MLIFIHFFISTQIRQRFLKIIKQNAFESKINSYFRAGIPISSMIKYNAGEELIKEREQYQISLK